MKGRFTMADYIVAALLGAVIGTAAAYIVHRDCQEQAVWAEDYMQSAQYQTERAEHFKRLGEGIR